MQPNTYQIPSAYKRKKMQILQKKNILKLFAVTKKPKPKKYTQRK